MSPLTPADVAGLTLEQAHLRCHHEAFRTANAQGKAGDHGHIAMLTRLNARALGFLCDRGFRTLLLSERHAQPGRNYADALEWARTIEPPMANTVGRIPACVSVERAIERRAA